MKEEIKLEPSEELAYWVGAVQTDGSLSEHHEKKRDKTRTRISFGIAEKSLPMVEKFRDISLRILSRRGKIYKLKRGSWYYEITVKQLSPTFKSLGIQFGDPPVPPQWTLEKPKFFGAYLAGVIDGDGDVRIKRPRYPQCAIRITSGSKQIALLQAITRVLGCHASILYEKKDSYLGDRKISGASYRIEFCVSSKTFELIKDFVLPHMTLAHKREKILQFIHSRFLEN